MLQTHLLERYAPNSLALLYRPVDTGNPGHDMSQHISRFVESPSLRLSEIRWWEATTKISVGWWTKAKTSADSWLDERWSRSIGGESR